MYNLSLNHSLGIAEQTYYIFSNNHHSLDDRQDNHNKKSFHPSIGKKQKLCVDELVETCTEVSQTMHKTYSSHLHHFIKYTQNPFIFLSK
jgi:hypothetical protein